MANSWLKLQMLDISFIKKKGHKKIGDLSLFDELAKIPRRNCDAAVDIFLHNPDPKIETAYGFAEGIVDSL